MLIVAYFMIMLKFGIRSSAFKKSGYLELDK